MALADDLEKEVRKTFNTSWTEETTEDVPDPEDLLLNSNHSKKIEEATILYADLDGSTNMVDTLSWQKAAEIYKCYLRCASEIIRSEGGAITAYDGDRVMAVYTGGSKNTTAVRTAMKINRAVLQIIRPAYAAQYPQSTFTIKHVIGIHKSILRTARIGVRGDNDIVWVGSAANHAAKLTALSENAIWITESVYNNMSASVMYVDEQTKDKNMWRQYTWTEFDKSTIYGTSYYWGAI